MLRHLFILLLIALLPLSIKAQEEAYYYPFETGDQEPRLSPVESDTTLFYRPILHTSSRYPTLTRYTFSYIASSPRGELPYLKEHRLAGIGLSYSAFQLLTLLDGQRRADQGSLFWEGFERGHRLRLNYTDCRYRLGMRYTYGVESRQGWQLQLLTEGRIGRDLYTHGCYTRSLRLALRLQKRWERLRLTLLAGVHPFERGLSGNSTEEAFTLLDDPYYNPSWGYFRGEERSARVRREWMPAALLGGEYDLSERTQLRLSLALEAGISRQSGLEWFNAPNPTPDYYRTLPSAYSDPYIEEVVAARWRAHDTRYTQINWEELYAQNRMTGGEALYVEKDQVERLTRLDLSLGAKTSFNSSLLLEYGVEARYMRERHYLELRDLLGAEYLTDRDCYLIDDDTYSTLLENDLRHPSRRVGEGERFSHDYALERMMLQGKLRISYHTDRLLFVGAVHIGEELLSRYGYFEKELFSGERSFGRSRWISAPRYSLHAEGHYALSMRQALGFRLHYEAKLPMSDALFLQPKYNNRTIEQPTPEGLLKGEISYRLRHEKWELSGALFLHLSHNGTETGRYYDDLSTSFCDRVVREISTIIYGAEFSAEWRALPPLSLLFTASGVGSSYVGSPRVSLYDDRDNRLVDDDSKAYMKGCHPGALPHLALSASGSYYGHSWGTTLTLSMAAFRYAHPDYMRRTVRIAQGAATSPEAFKAFMHQAQLPEAFRIDLSLWKSFHLGERSRLVLYGALRNLTGKRTTPYDQYESHRIRRIRAAGGYHYLPMEDRLRYASPRSLYLSVSFHY